MSLKENYELLKKLCIEQGKNIDDEIKKCVEQGHVLTMAAAVTYLLRQMETKQTPISEIDAIYCGKYKKKSTDIEQALADTNTEGYVFILKSIGPVSLQLQPTQTDNINTLDICKIRNIVKHENLRTGFMWITADTNTKVEKVGVVDSDTLYRLYKTSVFNNIPDEPALVLLGGEVVAVTTRAEFDDNGNRTDKPLINEVGELNCRLLLTDTNAENMNININSFATLYTLHPEQLPEDYSEKFRKLPQDAQLAELKALIGSRLLLICRAGRTIRGKTTKPYAIVISGINLDRLTAQQIQTHTNTPQQPIQTPPPEPVTVTTTQPAPLPPTPPAPTITTTTTPNITTTSSNTPQNAPSQPTQPNTITQMTESELRQALINLIKDGKGDKESFVQFANQHSVNIDDVKRIVYGMFSSGVLARKDGKFILPENKQEAETW